MSDNNAAVYQEPLLRRSPSSLCFLSSSEATLFASPEKIHFVEWTEGIWLIVSTTANTLWVPTFCPVTLRARVPSLVCYHWAEPVLVTGVIQDLQPHPGGPRPTCSVPHRMSVWKPQHTLSASEQCCQFTTDWPNGCWRTGCTCACELVCVSMCACVCFLMDK